MTIIDLFSFCYIGSKLTAGIHKLADTLTKTGKKKSFDRQNTPTSPTDEDEDEEDNRASKPPLERKVSFDDQVSYVDRQSSTENLLNGDDSKTEKHVDGVQNDSENDEEQPDDYLQLVREPSSEEKEVELKVQQKIDALRKGEEGSQPVSKHLNYTLQHTFLIITHIQGSEVVFVSFVV